MLNDTVEEVEGTSKRSHHHHLIYSQNSFTHSFSCLLLEVPSRDSMKHGPRPPSATVDSKHNFSCWAIWRMLKPHCRRLSAGVNRPTIRVHSEFTVVARGPCRRITILDHDLMHMHEANVFEKQQGRQEASSKPPMLT